MRDLRRWPAPWAFGVLILPLGVYVGYISTALPFLLNKVGIPVDEIARIGSLLYVPPILMFLWTPVVDVKLRRRAWLILGASVTALCMFVASLLLGPSHLRLLTLLLFFGGCLVALVAASCGGLMATMLSASAQSKAAGWNLASPKFEKKRWRCCGRRSGGGESSFSFTSVASETMRSRLHRKGKSQPQFRFNPLPTRGKF